MALTSSAIRSGKMWIGFVAGALGIVVCPIMITLLLDRIDPPRTGGDRQIKAAADVLAITEALQLYRKEHGRFPTADEGLSALVPNQLNQIPIDPWGTAYIYSLAEGVPYVASLGSDGKSGGEGTETDVTRNTIEAIRSNRGRFLPTPVGLALVLIGGLIVPILALRMPGRPLWAVGMLAGAASSIAFLSFALGATAADGANAQVALLLGLVFAGASLGVLLRARYSDSLTMTGFAILAVGIWVLSNSIAR